MKKSTTILVVVLVAVAFGGAGYWFGIKKADDKTATATPTVTATASTVASATTTADPTASWKTYTNDKYGFSFKYPAEWIVKDITTNNSQISGLKGFYIATLGENVGDSWYNVEITSNPISDEINKAMTASNPNAIEKSKTDLTKYNTTITAVTSKNKTTQVTYTQYFFSKNGLSYILTGPTSDTSDANVVIGNKIVDTFQLTK